MSDVTVDEIAVDEGIPVLLPSGAEFLVMTDGEREYVETRVRRYDDQLHLNNVSDLAQLDLMIELELLTHRWSLWLSRQKDYWNDSIDEIGLRRSLNDFSTQIRQIKKDLGVDKVTRDKTRGEESVSVYLENLRARAKEFGIMREKQLAQALELSQQLISLVTLHDNCTDDERRDMHVTVADLMEWLHEVYIPEFQSVDAYFRANQQRFWIRSQ